MLEHEYSVLGGINRAQIGRYLAIAASITASAIMGLALIAFDLAQRFGLNAPSQIILWPVTSAVLYAGLHWLFDSWIWRWRPISQLLRVPDLSGTWKCEGQGVNTDRTPGYPWEAEIVIVQSWDRIRVRMQTSQSTSNSEAAALVHDAADGFRLLFNYWNRPRAEQTELKPHRGCADLMFSKDLKTARGEYFNGLGRFTFGSMTLTRLESK